VQANIKSQGNSDVVDRVQSILNSRGLTLSQVSQQSERIYGRSSPFFVPHNLYYELKLGDFSPSLPQLCALSQITDYQFGDWFLVFGFDLEKIPQLQAILPNKRTIILDTRLNNPNSWISEFRFSDSEGSNRSVVPIRRFVEFSGYRRLGSAVSENDIRLYAKIGYQDALAFPDLLPGSIVCTRSESERKFIESAGHTSDDLFLVEHGKGLTCCRLHFLSEGRVVLISNQLPYAQIELQFPAEVRLHGILDQEFRFLTSVVEPEVPKGLATIWRPERILREGATLGKVLSAARKRMAFSFREASERSARIAERLGDARYFVASGSLSDYEALDGCPRHIHKIFTLCVLYGVPFSAFLESAGFPMARGGQQPIPDHLIPRMGSTSSDVLIGSLETANRMRRLPGVEGPILTRGAFGTLSGLANLNTNDVFWIGGAADNVSPHLKNGVIAVLNRRRKRPVFLRSKALWQQPLYVILKREESYECACCSLEGEMLVIHPCSGEFQPPKRLINGREVEVVGQIVTIARDLRGT
jgi:hypothetical protein